MKYIYLCAICTICLSCLRTSEDLIEEQNRNRMRTSSTMESGTMESGTMESGTMDMVEGDCRKESDACAEESIVSVTASN